MTIVLPALVETTATRLALHRLAEDVLAAEQQAAIGTIRLQVLPGAIISTRWFPGVDQTQHRIRIEGGDLVREVGDVLTREPIAGDVEPAAAAVLYAWYELGAQVLGVIAAERGSAASEVVLWPEHFDLGVTIDLGADVKINLGYSPGDEFSPEPYLYAGPWQAQSGPFWNAPFGAYRTYSHIRSAQLDDGGQAFLESAMEHLALAASAPTELGSPGGTA